MDLQGNSKLMYFPDDWLTFLKPDANEMSNNLQHTFNAKHFYMDS